jgi:tetratricopeptide (TPR) repeat protein
MKATRKAQPSRPAPQRIPATLPSGRRHIWRMAALCILVVAAYSNSFQAGLIFDNAQVILRDARIRALTPENVSLILSRTYSKTSSGLYRPLTTFSYLLNYAVFGDGAHPAGYHWVNLVLHTANVLLVYLLGTLLFEASAPAFALAALWGVHPLLTESVTNIVGRADLLAAVGVLTGLLCYIKSASAAGRKKLLWLAGLAVAQAIGLFSKENAAILPGLMLLHDVAWPKRAPWRDRAAAYAALVLPFAAFLSFRAQLPMHVSVSNTDNPLLTAGFLTARLTAIKVIGKYLLLFVWPARLSPDYSYNAVPVFGWHLTQWEDAKTVVALAACAGAAWLAVRCYRTRKPLFFFLAFFFVALLPTANLLMLIGSIMAERFVYLPSIGLAGCLVALIYGFSRKLSAMRTAWIALSLLCLACAARTYARNFDWKDERSLWTSAVDVCPESAKAHYNLGTALLDVPGALPDAIAQFETALRINPDLADAHVNLGKALSQMPGRLPDAIAQFEAALRLDPDSAEAHSNLGSALMHVPGQLPDAIAQFEAALRLDPDFADAHANLGGALSELPGRLPDAIAQFETALRINPTLAEVHANLGTVLLGLPDRLPDATAQFEAALQINPDLPQVHNNLGIALAQTPGRLPDAIAHFEAALRLDPDFAAAHTNLGSALMDTPGRLPDAIAQFQAALRIAPDSGQARTALQEALSKQRSGANR